MIADCETCDRRQVPCKACEVSQRAICFICQGDEADPYCELTKHQISPFLALLAGVALIVGIYAAQSIFSGPPQHLPFGCEPKDTTASGECQ